MQQEYSIKNVFKKMKKSQIVGIVLFVVILVLALVLVGLLAEKPQDGNSTSGDENGESSTVVETYTGEDGYTYTKEIVTDENGDATIVETKTDEYGNVTTVAPGLITTYFPYQVMREHSDYIATLRYSFAVDEESKTITGLVEYCDAEGDKALAQEYLNSIPMDLSEYTVIYDVFSEDAFCTEEVGW